LFLFLFNLCIGKDNATVIFNGVFGYVFVLIATPILSTLSVLGDLSASTIKRNFGAKDFGNFFPGHGGILDRFDSVLYVTPILYGLVSVMLMIR
jgi:phosphatidate cytidylyltransferase